MIPPEIQPVNVVCFSFKQQHSSNKRQVVRSGQVNGQLSHQQKQGFNLQQQCNKCGSFSWQQPLQSVQVSHPQPQPLLHELQDVDVPQVGSLAAALQLVVHDGAALLLQLSDAAAGAGAGVAGAAGAAGAVDCDAL
jgi:hypothetical protein